MQLSDGTSKLSDGTAALANGSKDLQAGITAVSDGITVLNTSLNDGADKVSKNAVTDNNIDMFVNPLSIEETQVTTVKNNGHAMAAYMMSVGLWVWCLAFCLMVYEQSSYIISYSSYYGSCIIFFYKKYKMNLRKQKYLMTIV